MRILALVFTLVLGITSVMAQSDNQTKSDPQSWATYTVEKRDFSVTMPVTPVLTLSHKTADGNRRPQQSLKASADAVTYSVLVSENPKPQKSLKDFIDAQIVRGWDRSSERSITTNGVEGREYISHDRQVVAQFFASDRGLYRFLTSGAPAEDPRVKQFFSSITFGEKLEGLKVKPQSGVVYYHEDELEVFKGKDVDSRVRVLAKPEPVAVPGPPEGRSGSGTVILRAVFSSTGEVVNITVVKGISGGYTERAIEAARRIKFVPATRDGKPVSMWMQLEYNFAF